MAIELLAGAILEAVEKRFHSKLGRLQDLDVTVLDG